MGFYKVHSATILGLKVEFVQVEADAGNGLPMFHMVGYLSSEVKEAAERVRTAMRNAGYTMPAKKIVINLSPACVRKKGSIFDLPIAVAVLGAMGIFPEKAVEDTLLAGELGLDGKLQPVEGILPIVLEAKKAGFRCCVIPKSNEDEGWLAQGIQIFGAETLEEVCRWLKGEYMPQMEKTDREEAHGTEEWDIDYSDIQGQEAVKRATMVAVAGGHNLLYVGPPGSGKTMLAKRIPTILPPLDREESLEITGIYSTAGEATLAHGGVLFLDELAEFPRGVLEVLRQPLEEKCIHLARQQGAYIFPADFMLVAATNPCPCGMAPGPQCTCTPGQIRNYQGKLSQPFLDRIDICMEAPKVEYEELTGKGTGMDSRTMRGKVMLARMRQMDRFREEKLTKNAQMGQNEIEKYCRLGKEEERMMRQAYEVMKLTVRSYHKVLKVARTIADMEEKEEIDLVTLREALGYRVMDKEYWG